MKRFYCLWCTSTPDGNGSLPPMKCIGNASMLRSEEHTSELQSRENIICRLPLEKKKKTNKLEAILARMQEKTYKTLSPYTKLFRARNPTRAGIRGRAAGNARR